MAVINEAFPDYCRRDRARLVAMAVRLTGSVDDAEDLVHEVLVKLSRRWVDVGALDHVDAFARRALINAIRTYQKRAAAERRALERLAGHRQSPVPAPMEPEDERLWSATRALPGRQAEVLALIADGHSGPEVAEVLGVSAAVVRQTLRRARVRLRESLVEAEQ